MNKYPIIKEICWCQDPNTIEYKEKYPKSGVCGCWNCPDCNRYYPCNIMDFDDMSDILPKNIKLSLYSREEKVKSLLTEWANCSDNDLCWNHNNILKPLCDLYNIPINHKLNISKEEFEKGCCLYQKELFPE